MRRRLRRATTIIIRLAGIVGFLFSTVCTFLGLAPQIVIAAVIGPRAVSFLHYLREQVLGITSEQARWLLVVFGDIFGIVSLGLFFFVFHAGRMAKRHPTQGDLAMVEARLAKRLIEVEHEATTKMVDLEMKASEMARSAKEKLAVAAKKERTARKLHNSTYQMLKRIRMIKGDVQD
jgi:hypothetical protein